MIWVMQGLLQWPSQWCSNYAFETEERTRVLYGLPRPVSTVDVTAVSGGNKDCMIEASRAKTDVS